MIWFSLALVAPLLYAITNYIDKILLQKYFQEGGVGTLILFSALLSFLALPVIFLQAPDALSLAPTNIALLVLVGLLDLAILWFYLLALDGDEPSIIIVFYQLVPVFALGLGYIFLGEVLTTVQLAAMAIVILGTTLVSFELDDERNFTLKANTVIFMTAAAFCWALESVLFKYVALEENVWRALFWEHLTLVVAGVLIFALVAKYRTHFLAAIRSNSKAIIGLNVTNEGLYMLGNIVVAFAVMMAPVALILLAQPFQSLFVLLFGVLLTLFFPALYSENINRKHLVQKVIAIIVTGIGTFMLLSVSN